MPETKILSLVTVVIVAASVLAMIVTGTSGSRISGTRFLTYDEIGQNGTSTVKTKYGPILGYDFGTYRRFYGVPFAYPPLGELRWKDPRPPGLWSNVLDCRNFTIGCAQLEHSLDVPKNVSEDCLYLEVFAPPEGKYSTPGAVMLFYHGGAFKQGGESFAIYDGSYIASTSNIVVVATNYRLGVFGFLYSFATDANVGLQDQRFALKWVQENIRAFGGDPNLVTIFGESAGGESVLIHLANPQNEVATMFHRAIVESGPMALNFRETVSALIMSEWFALELGCPTQSLSCLQNKTTAEVLTASKIIGPILDFSEAVMRWSPVVDGKSFVAEPIKAFENGKIVNVPFMIGSNVDDGLIFANPIGKDGYVGQYLYIAVVTGLFPTLGVTKVFDQYPSSDGNNVETLSQLITDYLFVCDSRMTLRLAQRAGLDDLYYYQFDSVPPCFWPKSQKPRMWTAVTDSHRQYCCDRVCHGDELPYVFHDSGSQFPWSLNQTQIHVMDVVNSYWKSFAIHGDPNKERFPGAVNWEKYDNSTDLNIRLQVNSVMESGLRREKCDMFDTLGYDTVSNVMKTIKKILQMHDGGN